MVLPKYMRLRGYKCFNYIHKFARRYNSHSLLLKVVKANTKLASTRDKPYEKKSFRWAISISTKVSKKAVERNRLRRLLHCHLRKRINKTNSLNGYWALLSLRPNSLNKNQEILLEECDNLLHNAGILK